MEKRKRSNQIILRLSDYEKYILDAKCENAGYRNKSDYLRHLILYGYTYFVDYSELHDYNVNLSRISKSLNQIAKRASATGNIYKQDMEEVKEMMKEVMLSERKHCVHTNPIEASFDLLSKATVQKALKYICNPEKTDGQILIDSFAYGAETAHHDFKDALSKSSGVGDKQAFHLIQSFAPGEVDFDTAHQIGIELADRLLENKYSYVIATHIDHDHCHNHIIFCAVDNVEHKKYNDCKRTYSHIRNLSDELCREHGLSVIVPSRQKRHTCRGRTHYEWQMAKAGASWKAQMKQDLDTAIREADSYGDFINRMRAKGYSVKGEDFGDDALKYLSFCASGQSRFTHASVKNFGEGYTKEAIRERIEKRLRMQACCCPAN